MRTFLDTNVVVYAFDPGNAGKQRTTVEIMESDMELVISTQVLLAGCPTLEPPRFSASRPAARLGN